MWNRSRFTLLWMGLVLLGLTAENLVAQPIQSFPKRILSRTQSAIQWSLKDPRNRTILLATVLSASAAYTVDHQVQSYAQDKGLLPENLSHFGDIYGGYWAQWILLTGIVLEGVYDQRDRSRILGNLEYAAMAITATGVMTGLIKTTVGRERPNHQGYRSFPSGHTSNAFAVATVANQLYGKKVGTVAYSAATVVAISRIHDNKHYLSDVIAGAGLGIIIGRSFGLAYAPQLSVRTGDQAVLVTFTFSI